MSRHLDPNHQYYVDSAPVVDGKAYFGEPNQDPTVIGNQITIYSDRNLTPGTEILQPVPTDAQGRVIPAVYMAENEYSYQVFDALDNLILDEPILEPLNVLGLVQTNINLNGFRFTNAGEAEANDEFVTLGQANRLYPVVVDTDAASTENDIVVNLPFAPDILEDGQQVVARLGHAGNSGSAVTLKLNTFPAKDVYIDNNNAVIPVGATGGINGLAHFVYDEANDRFALKNPKIGSVRRLIYTSDDTYIPQNGTSKIDFEVLGAGGGGGGCSAITGAPGSTNSSGAGGGGGGSVFDTTETIAASYDITVGVGGSGGAAGNNNGTDGGDSIVTDGASYTLTGGGGAGGEGALPNGVTAPSPGGEGLGSDRANDGGIGGALAGGVGIYNKVLPTALDTDGNDAIVVSAAGNGGNNINAPQPARPGGDGYRGLVIVTEYL